MKSIPGILDPAKDDIGMLDIIKINTMLKIKIFDLIIRLTKWKSPILKYIINLKM